MEKEYSVTVDVDSFEVFTTAKSKEEAVKKVLDSMAEDPDLFYEIDFSVQDKNVEEV